VLEIALNLAAAPERDFSSVIVWSLALIGVVVVGLVVVSKVKKRLQEPDQPVSVGFTLSDLRQLHKSGQMSDEEYERAKAKVVDAAKRAAQRVEAPGRARRPGAAATGATGLELPPDVTNGPRPDDRP
jgi:hypothetical protein